MTRGITELLKAVASFDLTNPERQKAVEELRTSQTGTEAKCVKYKMVLDTLGKAWECQEARAVSSYAFKDAPSSPDSFILAFKNRFSSDEVKRANGNIVSGQAKIESLAGRSLDCYVGGEREHYSLVCENKSPASTYSDDFINFGPKM